MGRWYLWLVALVIFAIGCGGRSDGGTEDPGTFDGGRDVRSDTIGEQDAPRVEDVAHVGDASRVDGADVSVADGSSDDHAEDTRDSGGSPDLSDDGTADAPFDSIDTGPDRSVDDADVRDGASADILDGTNDVTTERDVSNGTDAPTDAAHDVSTEQGLDAPRDTVDDARADHGSDDAPTLDADAADACIGCGLVGLTVTPAGATVIHRFTCWMHAVGTYADGSVRELTQYVTWSVSDGALGHVSNRATTYGLLTGGSSGILTVTAALGGITGSANVTVPLGDPFMIKMTPPVASIAAGTQQQLQATAIFSDATWVDWTSMLTWSSSNPSVATITDGVVTAVAPGTTTITGTLVGLTGTATVTVTPAAFTSLSMEPTAMTLPLGVTGPFRAIAHFSDGTTQNLTEQAMWGSTDITRAVVSDTAGSKGRVSGVAAGSATITASYGGLVVTAPVTVAPANLLSMGTLVPPSNRLMMFFTLAMSAYGYYSDGNFYNLSDQATWTSSDASIIQVSGRHITGVGEGTATVRATMGNVSGEVSVEVRAGALVSAAMNPSPASVVRGQSILFYVTGTYADGSTYELTRFFPWYTGDPNIAWIGDPTGESSPRLTGVNVGTTDVIVFGVGSGGSTAVTVTP